MDNVLLAGPLATCHFAEMTIYRTNKQGVQTAHNLLVLKDDDTGIVVGIPKYDVFCGRYSGVAPRYFKSQPRYFISFIANALNYIFKTNWWKYQINRLSDVTADMVFDALNAYAEGEQKNGTYRSQDSIDRYADVVSKFFANVAVTLPAAKLRPEELLEDVTVVSKKAKSARVVKSPRFRAKSKKPEESHLMRDISDEAMNILIAQAELHDKMLVFPIIIGITAGLRWGEICNLRQEHSPVSVRPGFQFSLWGETISAVKIDLRFEYQLRRDGKSVGGIKNERDVRLYPAFIERFMQGYNYHLRLLQTINYDPEFCPMLIDNRGNAMREDTLRKRFERLVTDYYIPALFATNDPRLHAYAQDLANYHLAPHILRHYFTVQLVLEGLNVSTIAEMRGDSDTRSAEVYVRNKGAFIRDLKNVHTLAIDALAAEM